MSASDYLLITNRRATSAYRKQAEQQQHAPLRHFLSMLVKHGAASKVSTYMLHSFWAPGKLFVLFLGVVRALLHIYTLTALRPRTARVTVIVFLVCHRSSA